MGANPWQAVTYWNAAAHSAQPGARPLPNHAKFLTAHLDGASSQPLRHASLRQQQLAPCQLLGLADVEGRDGVCEGW